MKTILLVEKDWTGLNVLAGIFRQWRQDIKILTAMDEAVTHQLMINHPVDVIFYGLNLSQTDSLQTLSNLTDQFPHVPLIAIGDKGLNKAVEVQRLGGYHYHERPLNSELLFDQVKELFEASTSGSIKGIPIHSFLQMLEGDAKTCTLQCNSDGKVGFIYMMEGVLIDAECGTLVHEEAVHEMIGWGDTVIKIRFYSGNRAEKIRKPLMSIIMEGMRLKDEKWTESEKQKNETRKTPRLKRFLTAGHRLSLDIGARVSVEFEKLDFSLSANMVGMIPDSYLIITTPEHFSITGTKPEETTGLMVKYLHLGKLCLFKSIILRAIHYPKDLLFISYPSLIHYHELRKAKRVAVNIPCRLTQADNTRFQGTLIDLSNLGGLCQMLAKTEKILPDVQIGEEVRISCRLPGLEEEQEILGEVRNIHKNIQEARIGIEFKHLHFSVQNTIKHYLDTIELG